MSRSTIATGILLALACTAPACKDENKQGGETGTGTAPSAEQPSPTPEQPSPAPEPAPSPAEPTGASYEISATQLGPLAADTAVTADKLGELFPGASVSAAVESAEGTEHQVFTVMLDGEDALVVTPGADGTVERVRVKSDRFRTVAGLGVGANVSELQALGELSCIGGADDYGDSVLCRAADTPTLAFVFAAPEADDYYAKPVPAEVQGKLLAGKKAVELLWQPGLGD